MPPVCEYHTLRLTPAPRNERDRKRHLKQIPPGARNHSFVSFCSPENSDPSGPRESNFCDLLWPGARTYTPPLFTLALSLVEALVKLEGGLHKSP